MVGVIVGTEREVWVSKIGHTQSMVPVGDDDQGSKKADGELFVQNNTKKRAMYPQSVVVIDEAKFSEFVHEEIYACAGCANHFRQRFLTDVRYHFLGPVLFPNIGQQ